jgi:ComEC/Rec2-related protein
MAETGLRNGRVATGEPAFYARTAGGTLLPLEADPSVAATTPKSFDLGRLRRQARFLPTRVADTTSALIGEEIDHGHLFLFLPVCLGTGSILWFGLARDPPPGSIVAGFMVCTLCAVLTRHRSLIWHLGLSIASLVLAGMLLAEVETWRRGTVMLDSPVTTVVTGRVERREADGQGRWRYLVRLDATADPQLKRPPERVQLLARSISEDIAIGAVISGRARLSPPSGPALPGLNDFAFSSYFDGIGAIGYFYGAPKQMSPPGDKSASSDGKNWLSSLDAVFYQLRSTIAERIRATVPGDAGAFSAAIVTDERRAISPETTEALRLAGLAHIIAISGLNMALAAGIFFVGVRTAFCLFPGVVQAYPVKKIAAGGALAMATAYYLISGFAVSAERAYLMMAILLIAVFFDRPSISLRNIALSAIAILALAPSEVMGPSFQMSFSATVALVAGYAFWARRAAARRKPGLLQMPAALATVWTFVAGIFVTSLIGGFSTMIFSVEHFHRIATYGLAANLAAMPLISFVVMPAALVGMLLMPFGLDGPFLHAMGWGLEGVIAIAKIVASWGGDVPVGRQPWWFLSASSAGFVALTLLRSRLRLVGVATMAASLGLALLYPNERRADLLVAEDGQLVALVGHQSVTSNRPRPPDFIYDQWRRVLLLPEHQGPMLLTDPNPVAKASNGKRQPLTKAQIDAARALMREALRTGTADRFSCVKTAWCIVRSPRGPVIATVENPAYAGAACDLAGIVIVARRLSYESCRSGALLVTSETLRRTGALEIDFAEQGDPSPIKVHAAMIGSDRPWNSHRRYDWRSGGETSDVPQALLEKISDSGG